jgi:hypothetical protein
MKNETHTHTPTPWRRDNQDFNSHSSIGILSDDGPIANVIPLAYQHEANAAFIVRAVNSHARLVEALKGLVETIYALNFRPVPEHCDEGNDFTIAFNNARQALRDAGEQV